MTETLSTPQNEKEIGNLSRKYALLNAIQHDGKADQGSVIGRILAEIPDLRKDAKRVKAIVVENVVEVNKLTFREAQNRSPKHRVSNCPRSRYFEKEGNFKE